MAVILGIDPGSRLCGYGLVDSVGNRLSYIDSGTIKVAALDFPGRLQVIFDEICRVIRLHQPQYVAVEEVFMGKNASSALKLGQARGAAIVACTSHELEVAEYSTRKVKQALVGSGRAEKSQIQHMITAILCLPVCPAEDAADALAVAICHAHTRNTLIKMAGVRSSRRGRLLGS